MKILDNGNVGLNVSTPSERLHVGGNFRLSGKFMDLNNQSGTSGQVLSSTGTGTDWIDMSGTDSDWTTGSGVVYNNTDYIGIGTSAPIADLHLNGGRFLFTLDNSTYDSYINLNNTSHDIKIQTSGSAFASFNGNRNIGLGLQNTDKVGIGTNTPTSKLHLYGTSNNAADIVSETDASRVVKHWFKNANRNWSIGQIGTTQSPNYSFQITDETAGETRLSINTDGKILFIEDLDEYLYHIDRECYYRYIGFNSRDIIQCKHIIS